MRWNNRKPPRYMLKTTLAIAAGKLSAHLIRLLNAGSATSLPGKTALRIDPGTLARLGRQIRQKTVAISGTNGKSTTAGLLSAFIEAAGHPLVHNQLGANMVPGITAALVGKASWTGRLDADYGVLEVDEASLPAFSKAVKQDVTIVTNLFRDQLDRYGELDTTARLIRQGIEQSGGALVLNADDPMVAAIGRGFPTERVFYYGVNRVDYPANIAPDFPVGFPREVTDCPVCQAPLNYSATLYGHLGHYACPNCDFRRPTPNLEAEHIQIGPTESRITLRTVSPETLLSEPLTLHLPGLFNAYNLLAAAAGALWVGLPATALAKGVSSYHSLFGRAEKKQIDGKDVLILLIKNPVGAGEVLKVAVADPQARLVIMINDNYADGRDVSWLWDAPFELLAGSMQRPIIVSGSRAHDMAVRLKYAGVPESRIDIQPDIHQAFRQGLQTTQPTETLYVLPTYTALLDLSRAIGSR